jgi:hypothetical protein
VVRIAIFLAYLWAISLMADIRRVFQYHGAEHKTIAAWEHGEVLEPENVDRYSTLHVRCGTNFLIMVMLLAVVVYTVAGSAVPPPEGIGFFGALLYHVVLRIVLLPVVAGLAYEGLRLGRPSTGQPAGARADEAGAVAAADHDQAADPDQIEVAIRSFEAVVPAEHREGRVPTRSTARSPWRRTASRWCARPSAEVRVDGDPSTRRRRPTVTPAPASARGIDRVRQARPARGALPRPRGAARRSRGPRRRAALHGRWPSSTPS